MRTLFSPYFTFVCMAIHRSQKMVHVEGNEHLVICKICEEKGKTDELKNLILTFFYFNRNLLTTLFILPVIPVAMLSEWWTGRPGSFEHPPEHQKKRWATN
jgi:hypothetical protein